MLRLKSFPLITATALTLVVVASSASSAFAKGSYTVPPTHSTYGHVPVISDAQMRECVELYNQQKWAAAELSQTRVNHYSQQSVDAYNQQVNKINQMTNEFNKKCAGKQSESACKEANRLNRERGLPEVSCAVSSY